MLKGQYRYFCLFKSCLDRVLESWLEASQFSSSEQLIKFTPQSLLSLGPDSPGHYAPALIALESGVR